MGSNSGKFGKSQDGFNPVKPPTGNRNGPNLHNIALNTTSNANQIASLN